MSRGPGLKAHYSHNGTFVEFSIARESLSYFVNIVNMYVCGAIVSENGGDATFAFSPALNHSRGFYPQTYFYGFYGYVFTHFYKSTKVNVHIIRHYIKFDTTVTPHYKMNIHLVLLVMHSLQSIHSLL